MTKKMLQKFVETSVIIFMLVTTSIGGSSACPSGCICRGRPEQRDTAVCYKSWAYRDKAVKFDEPITSIEFRHLLFQDVEPYLSAVRHASTIVIYPPKTSPSNNPLPYDIFNGMEEVDALTIHPTRDRLAPAGLARSMKPLTTLRSLDLVGNTMQCDCSLPDTLASQHIFLLAKSRMPAVKGCKQHGFPTDLYHIDDFLKKCAELGDYKLSKPSYAGVPAGHSGLSYRKFGNIRDQNAFNAGIVHSRINANPMKPSGAKSSPGAFRGALGKPPSGDKRRMGPGEKRVLLPGAISGRSRVPPAISAMQLARLHTKNSRPRAGKWGRRKLLSFGEDDSDPALSGAIDLQPGEEMRERREAVTQEVSSRRRQPVEVTTGMTKRLSGGWRMRDIPSIDGINDSDSAISTAFSTLPRDSSRVSLSRNRRKIPMKGFKTLQRVIAEREKSKGKRRRKNQWAKHPGQSALRKKNKFRGKRSVDDEDSNDLHDDESSRSNKTQHQLPEVTSNNEQQESRGDPKDANQLEPQVDVDLHHRHHDHPPGEEHDHHHHNIPAERALQLAVYQLPMNDLTVKLNPFDPFEVDLFFQYILHKESSSFHHELPHP